jgi:hypothetical protein
MALFACRNVAAYRRNEMSAVEGLQLRICKAPCSDEVYKIVEDALNTIGFLEAQLAFRNFEIEKLKEMNMRQLKMLDQCGYGE